MEDFSKVLIGGSYNVVLEKGSDSQVIIEIDENLIKFIDVEVFGRTLDISNDNYVLSCEKGIDVTVIYSEIEEIKIKGACRLYNEGTLETDFLTLDMSGAGLIEMKVETKELMIDISGAGAVELSGITDYQEVNLSGAGGYKGMDLSSKTCIIGISGVGGADVYVEDKLEARISGLGGVNYHGEPEEVLKDVSGLGTVLRAD